MNKIIIAVASTLLLAILVSNAYGKDDIYSSFYKNEENCSLLAKASFEAYRMFADSHLLLLSFGNNSSKYDRFYNRKFKEMQNISYIRSNRLFTDEVVNQLLRDAIYIWEKSGNDYITEQQADYRIRFKNCMSPTEKIEDSQ
ncbi:MAG: hypothetical protein ACD_2C00204G0002 [uncultured bacterium (gcode 4)]|uniref:Uncharacterized protein n=1 Tax=uncultured bacterium (gcode 4) TaxID=1234023 RepID=K2FDQ3_9BACT|nr:MAG: hypothetical protein ACD_2C00204G0002 [uncultured bacterium (gcode 4)]